jgi:hypothetical protein
MSSCEAAGATPVMSAHQSLYKDVIQCILPFLDVHDYISAMRINKLWYTAATTPMGSTHLAVTSHHTSMVAKSSIRENIAHFNTDVVDVTSLRAIRLSMTRLVSLKCRIYPLKFPIKSVHALPLFSLRLRQLEVKLFIHMYDDVDRARLGVNGIYHRIGMAVMLERLIICDTDECISVETLNYLSKLQKLKSLKLLYRLPNHQRWTREHIDVFRSLSSLVELSVAEEFYTRDQLNWLTCASTANTDTDNDDGAVSSSSSSSFSQQLEFIDLDSTMIFEQESMFVKKFTSLTHLSLKRVSLADASFLRSFPKLKLFSIYFELMKPNINDVFNILETTYPNLTDVTLMHEDMTSVQLASLLANVPNISRLHLVGGFSLLSLDFVHSLPHLEYLKLELCGPIMASELLRLHDLPKLHDLIFSQTLQSQPDDETRAYLSDNVRFPMLTEVSYNAT